jgi:hypothetical protein
VEPARRLLSAACRNYEFLRVPLRFAWHTSGDAFALKKNKTVAETLKHGKYAALSRHILSDYAAQLGMPVGTFLFNLKSTRATSLTVSSL